MTKDNPELKQEAIARMLHDARADEIDRETAAMSDEEQEAFLAEAGVTAADREATLAAQHKRFEAARTRQGKSNVVTFGKYRRVASHGAIGLVAAAAAFAIFIGLLRTNNLPSAFERVTPPVTAARGSWSEADLERAQAYEAYIDSDYDGCLRHLDKAKQLDSDGETRDTVRRTREWCSKRIAPPK